MGPTDSHHTGKPAPAAQAPQSASFHHSKTGKKLKPGQPGTKKLMHEYGDKLVCVRYRNFINN